MTWSDYKIEPQSPKTQALNQWLQTRADRQHDPAATGPGDSYCWPGTSFSSGFIEYIDNEAYGIKRTYTPIGESFEVVHLGTVKGGCAPGPEETEFDVIATSFNGENIVAGIKAIRYLTGLGLKPAKDIFDAVRVRHPMMIKRGVAKEDARVALKVLIEEGGFMAEIHPTR